jgi:hypothetical protein
MCVLIASLEKFMVTVTFTQLAAIIGDFRQFDFTGDGNIINWTIIGLSYRGVGIGGVAASSYRQ